MKKTTKAAQMPPSITLRLSRGRSVKITWRPRQRVSSLLVKLLTKALAVFLPLSMGYAQAADVNALPTGGQVTAGSATINQTGNTLNINQASQKAALNWQSFNIGTNGTVNFVQPNSNAVALNRIGGNSASEIYGHLNANGQVFLMNPNGILFGRGSQVNVGGIVATTMQLGDADFLAGNYNFNNAGAGSVANYGLINATNSVALLGSDVSNQGSIFATTASLVSGNTVALDVSTDGLIRARVVDAAVQANIANSGDINATQVTLSAGQAKDTLNRVVNNSGVIKATGFSSLNGEITLQGGTTLNSGTLDATSATGNGGTVHMLGQHVGVIDSGSIDVSGATGGGTILVGGDYQGKNTSIENAQVTYVGAQTTLKADATQNGNGGKVIVWADDTTRAYGSISAQGGALGGNGGFVETSGHRYLDINVARVNTLALHGLTGNWLLDPTDITISTSADNNIGVSSGIFSASPLTVTTSNISAASINSQLASTNVTINTASSNSGGGIAGDITFDSTSGAILISETNSSPVSLTLNAENDINFIGANGTTFRAGTSTGQLNVNLNTPSGKVTIDASSSVTLDGSSSGSYGLTRIWLQNGRTLHNHGTLNITGSAAVHLGAASVFNNSSSGGVVNVAGTNGTGWAFFSNNVTDDGIITNEGVINVEVGTAFEAAYHQTATGVLNINNGVNLNLQNAHSIEGNINFNNAGAGELNINEYHGTTASLSNLTIAGGTVNVFEGAARIIPKVSFSGVTARNTTLNVGFDDSPNDDFFAGEAIIAGNTIFNNVNFIKNNGSGTDGRFEIINAKLGVTNSFVVPADVIYTGDVGYYATGDLTIYNDISVTTDTSLHNSLSLMAGWDDTAPLPLDNPTVSSSVVGNLIFDSINSNPAPIVSVVGNINLDASGYISQDSSSAAIITQDTLIVKAVDGISLDGDNQVRTFRATNTGTGDIDFYNVGDVAFDNISNQATGGYVDVESGGGIAQYGNIDTDGGDITVYATNDIDMDPDGVRSATINNSTNLNSIYYESTEGHVKIGLLDAGLGSVGVTAGRNIIDTNGFSNNIVASSAGLNAGVRYFGGQGNIEVDTQITGDPMMQEGLDIDNSDANSTSAIKIRNTGSPLLVNAYSSGYTDTLEITNNNSIHIGHIEGAVDTTITANGTSSDIEINANLYAPQVQTLLSEGDVTLTAGRDVLIYDDHVNAGTGMDVTAGRDIIVSASVNNASLYTASGNQNITAGRNITLTGGTSTAAYAEIKHAGSGNQIIDFINGGTLTLTGGTGISGNRARIENASLASNNSIQKIWRSTSGSAPAIVMNGGSTGGSYSTSSSIDFSNSAEIGSEFGQQVIYASTIAMAGMGSLTGTSYAGAIISAPNQQITTTGNVTLTGGFSSSPTTGLGDQFTYNSVTYNLASPAAIGDKNTLIQMLDIGGTLTLNGGSSTSGIAMVGSLHGVATGSIKANAVALNSSGSLAFLGGVEDIIVTNTFTNAGGAITDNSSGSHPWSIWALNPTKITGCGAGSGCFADFAQYGVTYGSIPAPTILGTGHGWLYSAAAPALTATTSTNYSRVYDGTANAYLAATNFTVAGANPGDTVALTSLTGNFANKNVGTAKAISGSAATFSVTAAGIPVYGYATPTISGLTADITQATLNWSVANATGNTGTTPVPGFATLSVIFGSDAVNGVVSAYDANNALAILSTATPEGAYTEKVTGLTGADAGNYSLASTGTTGVLTVGKSVITPEVEQEVTAVTSETISQPEDTQTKQEEDEVKNPEKVLVALNFVDDPKDNKENPIETEKPKGRTLQCSVNK